MEHDRDTRELAAEYLELKLSQPVSRRGFLRLSGGIVVTTSFGALLAACGAPAASALRSSALPTAQEMTPSPNIAGSSIQFLGAEGEDAANVAVAKKWLADHSITLNSKYTGSGGDIFAAIKAGQSYDLVTSYNSRVQEFATGGVIVPVDTTRLSNWGDLWLGIRQADFLNVNGRPYGAPVIWGDGPYIYNPKTVPPAEKPRRPLDLLKPVFKKRLGSFNAPDGPFWLFGADMGFPVPNITKAQLAQVVEKATIFVKEQVVALSEGYGDATDLLVRGEVDLFPWGWEGMATLAAAKNVTLAWDNFVDANGQKMLIGYCDSMSIASTAANPNAAYAYMDELISPAVSAALALNLQSATVNSKALPLMPKTSTPYNYDLVRQVTPGAFVSPIPDEKPADPNMASHQDWLNAWAAITA